MERRDIEHPWLFARCREVQSNPDGYIDLWAREHYKSTIITFAKTIQDILASHGEDPVHEKELTFGIFSHTRPIAKGFLKQIKRELETNEVLKELFPDVLWKEPHREAPNWSEDGGLIVRRSSNPKEATIEAWGVVDGQPTSKHFDVLLYDDVVTKESINTPDMIEKTTNSLRLSYNLGAHGGVRRFIGTRYHYFDSYKVIMDSGTAKTRIYPATDDGTETGEPVLLDVKALKEKRRDQGPYIFGCQMLQNPKSDSSQGFKEEWIRYYDNVNEKDINSYILIDPANEKTKKSDYTAGWVVGLGPDQKIRILGIVRDRLNLPERTRLLFRWHRRYKPSVANSVRYEKYGKDADIDHIKGEMEIQTYDFNISAVGGATSKKDRIKRLIPYFEQGRILFPRSLHYTDCEGVTRDLVHDFIEQEYKAFPVPAHDDMLDSLARLFEPDMPLIWPKEKNTKPLISNNSKPNSWMGA